MAESVGQQDTGSVAEVTTASFEAQVIRESERRPVVVDFWAPWCGPCRALGPVLERLAQACEGRFLLAKVNSDDEPELARRYGVRGIPNVKAFVGGKVVDEFTGALPESGVRQFLDRVVPSPAEPLRAIAQGALGKGDPAAALAAIDSALGLDPSSEPARLDRIEILVALGRHDDARAALESLGDRIRDEGRAARLTAIIGFATGATDAAGLAARVQGDPGDLGSRLALARAHAAAGRHADALAEALEVVRRDRKFDDDAGRRTMLAIFDVLGSDSDLVRRYRRELAALINR